MSIAHGPAAKRNVKQKSFTTIESGTRLAVIQSSKIAVILARIQMSSPVIGLCHEKKASEKVNDYTV
jgi:hypothetical protein